MNREVLLVVFGASGLVALAIEIAWHRANARFDRDRGRMRGLDADDLVPPPRPAADDADTPSRQP